ncbi:MAG: DUF3098 domain-containing protein [Bacteroidota bacterium]|jgi:hypothetical protein|nr:DUF3098 domain-containing protein [Flavisolibacter sp.]MDQ3552622.1 DUF3098 domain-containing protein [Bacteroidota bacterium]
MKSKKITPAIEKDKTNFPPSLFDRENLVWMLAGVAVIILGFILMAGGRSEDPNVFNPDEVYSSRRITLAPIIIILGLIILIFAIFRHPKNP